MIENNQAIQDLINYVEEGQKRIDSAKMKLVSMSNDFDIWFKYSIDKTQYPFILGNNSPLMKVLSEHGREILEMRYTVIDTEWVVEFLNNLLREGIIDIKEVEEVKQYLYKINFGSMKIDW